MTWLAHFLGWWTADRVSAAGQVLGALGTIAAVIVALILARRDSVRGRHDEDQRLLAQARLVRVMGPVWGPRNDDTQGPMVEVFNHGDRPILDVQFDVWSPEQATTEHPNHSIGTFWIEPGDSYPLELGLLFEQEACPGWRVSWRDASGRLWRVDHEGRAGHGEALPWHPRKDIKRRRRSQ